ncbi:MAG: hypothetical protein GX625_21895 [Clostridiaceae bacterium]|jgi:hypothetical protein|nr:hypothetical protein [Clostridiaceae bacterium]
MAAIPNDYKEALGRVIVLTAISTEPAQSLRLCRSVMTLSSAALKKKRGKLPPEFLQNFLAWRQAWDNQAIAFAADETAWPQVIAKVSDILDYFVTICLEEDLISIQSVDQYFSDLFMNRKKPAEEDAER